MSQGKPRKEYLLKCAKEDHKPLDSYSKAIKKADKGDIILFDESKGIIKNLTKEEKK